MDNYSEQQWLSIAALSEILNHGAKSPTFSTHSIRHYVRHADKNGLHPHIRRIGRKLLVNRRGFIQWLDRYGQSGRAA